MPPKIDPYATPRARVIDVVLILFALLVIAIAIWTAPRHSAGSGARTPHAVSHAPVMVATNADR